MSGFGSERGHPLPLEARPKQGVAMVLLDPAGLVYTNEEKASRPEYGKLAGMRAIPMETKKPGETDEETLRRLFEEEVKENLVIGRPVELGFYGVGVAAVRCFIVPVIGRDGINPDYNIQEVGDPKWIPPTQLTDGMWVRQGVREMIRDYLSGARRTRRECTSMSLSSSSTNGLNGLKF